MLTCSTYCNHLHTSSKYHCLNWRARSCRMNWSTHTTAHMLFTLLLPNHCSLVPKYRLPYCMLCVLHGVLYWLCKPVYWHLLLLVIMNWSLISPVVWLPPLLQLRPIRCPVRITWPAAKPLPLPQSRLRTSSHIKIAKSTWKSIPSPSHLVWAIMSFQRGGYL